MKLKPTDYEGIIVEGFKKFVLSDADNIMLTKEIQDEEVKCVLFSMPSDLSSGSDDYNSDFFKASWPIVGKELLRLNLF